MSALANKFFPPASASGVPVAPTCFEKVKPMCATSLSVLYEKKKDRGSRRSAP